MHAEGSTAGHHIEALNVQCQHQTMHKRLHQSELKSFSASSLHHSATLKFMHARKQQIKALRAEWRDAQSNIKFRGWFFFSIQNLDIFLTIESTKKEKKNPNLAHTEDLNAWSRADLEDALE